MTIDEKNLIKGLKRRDELSLKAFIHSYGGLMKSVIYPYFPNSPEDREEVLNDAILKVWQNIDAYNQAKSEFKNWCAAVAKYRAIDYYRRYHKEGFHELFEEAHHIVETTTDQLAKERLENFLAGLGTTDRMILTALYIEGEKTKTLAQKLSLTENAIYKRVQKARQKAKQSLQAKEEV